jgi:hypothetical protein
MRNQYKVLSEKYSLVNESQVGPVKDLLDDLLQAETSEEFINIIKTNPLFIYMVKKRPDENINNALRIGETLFKHPYIESLPPSKYGYPGDGIFYRVVRSMIDYAQKDSLHKMYPHLGYRLPEENILDIDSRLAWTNWWEYYEPIKKATEQMKKAEDEANIKLDI